MPRIATTSPPKSNSGMIGLTVVNVGVLNITDVVEYQTSQCYFKHSPSLRLGMNVPSYDVVRP